MSAKKQKIGDPFEQIATTGRIGGKQTPNTSDVQQSESLAVQDTSVPEAQTAKAPNIQKSKHNGREQQTIYLLPHLVRKLKLYKAMHDIDYSDIVAAALEEYFNTHQ